MDLKPPFFVSEHVDIDAFPTVEDMASYVETYDLPEYEFFDAAGQRLKASAHGYAYTSNSTPIWTPSPSGWQACCGPTFNAYRTALRATPAPLSKHRR